MFQPRNELESCHSTNVQRRRQRHKPKALKNASKEERTKGVKNKPGREGDKTKMPGDNFRTEAMTDEGVG